MASSRVNIATMPALGFLVFAVCLFFATAKKERLDHGTLIELSDLISNLEKRLSDQNFDSNLFDKLKSPTSQSLGSTRSRSRSRSRSKSRSKDNVPLTSLGDSQERRREICQHDVRKGSIIRATDSLNAGAEFVDSFKGTESNKICQEYCCQNSSCDVAVYQDKGDRYCYLFHCGKHCVFKEHLGYLVNTVGEESSGSESDLENLSGGRAGHQQKAASPRVEGVAGATRPGDGSQEPPALEQQPEKAVISQHSVSLAGYCTQDNQCEDTNAACLSNNCRCLSGFYDKEGLCRTVCPPSQFECFELGTITRGPECIPKTQVCDSYMQCADGSDEFNCEASNAAAITQQGRGGTNQYMGSYNTGLGDSYSQPLPRQQLRANMQPQQQLPQQQQQQQALNRPDITSSQGAFSQQQLGGTVQQQPQQQQMNQVGPKPSPTPSMSQTRSKPAQSAASQTRFNPAQLAASTNTAPGSRLPVQEQNAISNQKASSGKLIPNSMSSNKNLSPYPTKPNSYQPSSGQAAYQPSSPMQQGQAPAPRVGMPMVGPKTLSQHQMPQKDSSKSVGPNLPHGNSVVEIPTPHVPGSEGNRMVPGVAGNQGQGYLAPPPNPSLRAQIQSGTGTHQAPHGAFTGPTQGKGGNAVKPLESSAAGISRPGASREQQQPHEDQQHAQAKTNKSGKPASGNYRPSSNSQQWVDPSVYLPYGYGSSDSSGPGRQQKVQPSLASGGYFEPVPSRYYPSGGYGQMSNAGYRQDNIPSSLFGNTASADEYSQFGGPYLSQAKSLTGKGYLSGRYPDMAAYDGSPSAVSSQYLQPTSGGGGAGGSYDFDGEYRPPQSYQDLEFYSPLSGQQGYKSQPSQQLPYKDKNSGFKSSAYKSRPGLYEEFPSGQTNGKPDSISKGQSSESKSGGSKSSSPTAISHTKPSAVPTKSHPSKSRHPDLVENKPSTIRTSTTTGKSPSPNHKLETNTGGRAKHLFVSSSREKVIIASPGGGNAEGPIVALSLGLALTLVLLVMVACRLRGFKHRLSKGRPLNQNEADYLINGMYL